MTEDELKAIAERAERATPGPWVVVQRDVPLNDLGKLEVPKAQLLVERAVQTGYDQPQLHAPVLITGMGITPFFGTETHYHHIEAGDADFIAHAREDIPRLVAALAQEREQADEVRRSGERSRPAAPAPEGPWRVWKVGTSAWWLTTNVGEQVGPLATEVEAVAVRDALNRLAAAPAQ
jgi:hypothetical protein